MGKTGWRKKIRNAEELTLDESSEKNKVLGEIILPDPYRQTLKRWKLKVRQARLDSRRTLFVVRSWIRDSDESGIH